jgi:hypothetical protein
MLLAKLLKYPMLTSELFTPKNLVFHLASYQNCPETERASLMTMFLLSTVRTRSFHIGYSFCGGDDGFFEIHRTGKAAFRLKGIDDTTLERMLVALEEQGVIKDDANLSMFLPALMELFESYSKTHWQKFQEVVGYEQALQWLRENYESILIKAKNERKVISVKRKVKARKKLDKKLTPL